MWMIWYCGCGWCCCSVGMLCGCFLIVLDVGVGVIVLLG